MVLFSLARGVAFAACTLYSSFLAASPFCDKSNIHCRGDWVKPSGFEQNDKPFSWGGIVPSTKLAYQPCHGGFECARLQLPLDWENLNATGSRRTVAIAVVRLPAKVSVTDPRYGGAIIINPGGPGGSGVGKVLIHGRQIQTIVDTPGEPAAADTYIASGIAPMYFDILGFDPRGIGYSTPRLQCFPDAYSRQNWMLQSKTEGIIGSSDVAFDAKWARWQSLSKSCMERVLEEGGDSIAYHMNTMPVVEDMAALTEKHGEWREAQSSSQPEWEPSHEKLLYWGVSYGSLIGQTFAATHPERVSRLVLDSVLLSDAYYHGNRIDGLVDADAVWDTFFDYCFESGPEKCPFHDPNGPEHIKQRYHQLLAALRADPTPVSASTSLGPDVVTESDVRTEVKEALYCPVQKFPQLALELAQLSEGNGSLLASNKQARLDHFDPPDKCKEAFSELCQRPGGWQDEASVAVSCSDGDSMIGKTKSSFRQYTDAFLKKSMVAGPHFAELQMPCVGWKVRPKLQFTGPPKAVTKHPILFVNNKLDPATPLRDAFEASENFQGSVVLQQISVGHSSWSSPSLCTAKAIRQYFHTGYLPEPGTICQASENPFGGRARKDEDEDVYMDEDDTALLEALRDLAMFCRG